MQKQKLSLPGSTKNEITLIAIRINGKTEQQSGRYQEIYLGKNKKTVDIWIEGEKYTVDKKTLVDFITS